MEKILSIIIGYDAVTLREKVDLAAVGARLGELGDMRSLDALCERAWLLKVANQLDDALDIANQAVRLARFTGNRRDQIRPRLLRSQVLQYQKRYNEAVLDLSACAEEAATHEWTALEALALQHRGKVYFDLGDFPEALTDFTRAVQLRRSRGATDEQLESTLIALAITESFIENPPAQAAAL